METEDDVAIKQGKISTADKMVVNIIKDEADNIKNIIIQNFRKYDRKMDIMNTITWTFRTIYEEQMR